MIIVFFTETLVTEYGRKDSKPNFNSLIQLSDYLFIMIKLKFNIDKHNTIYLFVIVWRLMATVTQNWSEKKYLASPKINIQACRKRYPRGATTIILCRTRKFAPGTSLLLNTLTIQIFASLVANFTSHVLELARKIIYLFTQLINRLCVQLYVQRTEKYHSRYVLHVSKGIDWD